MILKDLTEKQARFFQFVLSYAKENGVYPSYQTIMGETWLSSKNGVYQYLNTLYAKNYLRSVEWGGFELHPSKSYLVDSPENPIPIKGVITAGVMQEAVETDLGSLTVRDLFPQANKPYFVRVSGDSMQDAGIHDGDLVLLDDSELLSGEIGAVMYHGETTLKEVYKDKEQVVLYPKNKSHSPIHLKPGEFEEVKVLGKYIAHIHEGRVCYIE